MQLCKEQLTYFVIDERDRVEKAIPLFGSWYSKSASELTDKGMTFAQVTECRIPAEYAPQGFTPKENDMLLRGTFDGTPPAAALLKHRYHAVTVKAVRDNRRTVMAPHWHIFAV